MKHKIMGVWFVVGMLLLLPGLSRIACAGEINSAEQKIISAASETFSYQGKTYVIKSQYIAEGRSKLAEDGVDLSDGDVGSYIAQFRTSYAELVEGGYCEEVGGESGSGKDSGEKVDSIQNDTEKRNTKKENTGGNKDENNEKTPNKEPSEDGGSQNAHSPAEKAKNKLFIETVFGKPKDDSQDGNTAEATRNPADRVSDEDWLEEENLGTTVDFEEADLEAAKKQTLTVSWPGKHYQIQKQEKTEQTDNILSQVLYLKQWKILSVVILTLAFCSAVAIGWYIWTVLRRHHKKRKLRLGLAIAAGVSVAGCAFLFMLVMGFYFGIYNREAIHRQLMESDYYSGITQITREFASEQLREAGCDEAIAAEVFTLSHVYIEEKQYINAILAGKKNNAISAETVERVLQEQIPDTLGEQKQVLVKNITDMYRNTLQFELGEMIRESRQAFLPWCYGVAAASIFMILLLFILLYQMYGYLHKSVRVCTAGILGSSLLIAGASLVLKIQRFAGKFHAEPVYYQQFIQKYVNWSVNVMMYVGCIGLLAAVALAVWKRYLHMIYVE